MFVLVVATILAASIAWIPSSGLHGAISALMLGGAVQLTLGGAFLLAAVRPPVSK
jgi:hypothetical protein